MPDRVGILAVLVLHRCALADSATWATLQSQIDPEVLSLVDFHLLICDNTPTAIPPSLPGWAQYVAAQQNHGLAWAYNLGLAAAESRGAVWLLTLDQDTSLPEDFLSLTAATASRLETVDPHIAAIVPRLVGADGKLYSPSVAGFARERVLPEHTQPRSSDEVRAYNSAALLRVSALRSIGGYDRRFRLDYLDHALFHTLHLRGFRVWVQEDLRIVHSLSLHDGRAEISEQRFQDFSIAESAFRDLYQSAPERFLYTFRLLLRAINQTRRGDPAHFRRTTLRLLRQRIFLSRDERLRRWEQDVAKLEGTP